MKLVGMQVDGGHFMAGLELSSTGLVVRAAPIVKYMLGWDIKQVEKYCRKKGWPVKMIYE